jgi:hypothetical protein
MWVSLIWAMIIIPSLVWLLRRPARRRMGMGIDSSADKRGTQSSGRKRKATRHGDQPAPTNSPVPGAFGKEGGESEGRPATPSARRDDDEPEPAL